MLVFMISSMMAGLGGVVLASRLQGVNVAQGSGTLLIDAISAAVIGGTSLFGGRGEVRQALFGSIGHRDDRQRDRHAGLQPAIESDRHRRDPAARRDHRHGL